MGAGLSCVAQPARVNNFERTILANTLVKNVAYATYNVTLSDTAHGSESVTATQWYYPDQFSEFVISLLFATSIASFSAAWAAAYNAKRDAVFATKVAAAVLVVVVSGVLFVVGPLLQAIIPFIRGLNTPFSPELGTSSVIIVIFLIIGIAYLCIVMLRKGLRISEIELVPEQFDGQTGQRVRAMVENYDKRVIYDLSAQIVVTGPGLQLLRVERHENNSNWSVKLSAQSYRQTRYAWRMNGSESPSLGNWPEMRQHDEVALVYPEESTGVIFSGGPPSHRGGSASSSGMTSEMYLYLKQSATYKILLEIKGVDVNKNTVVARKNCSTRTS